MECWPRWERPVGPHITYSAKPAINPTNPTLPRDEHRAANRPGSSWRREHAANAPNAPRRKRAANALRPIRQPGALLRKRRKDADDRRSETVPEVQRLRRPVAGRGAG